MEGVEKVELRHCYFETEHGEILSKERIDEKQVFWWRSAQNAPTSAPAAAPVRGEVHDFANDPLQEQLSRHNLEEDGCIPHAKRVRKTLEEVLNRNLPTNAKQSDRVMFASDFLMPCHQASLRFETVADVPIMPLPPILGQDADRLCSTADAKDAKIHSGYAPLRIKHPRLRNNYLKTRYNEISQSLLKASKPFKRRILQFLSDHDLEIVKARPLNLYRWHNAGRHIHGFFLFVELNEKMARKKIYLLDVFNFFLFPFHVEYERWTTNLQNSFDIVTAYNLHFTEFFLENQEVFLELGEAAWEPYDFQYVDPSSKHQRRRAMEDQNDAIFQDRKIVVGGFMPNPSAENALTRKRIKFWPIELKLEDVKVEVEEEAAASATPEEEPLDNWVARDPPGSFGVTVIDDEDDELPEHEQDRDETLETPPILVESETCSEFSMNGTPSSARSSSQENAPRFGRKRNRTSSSSEQGTRSSPAQKKGKRKSPGLDVHASSSSREDSPELGSPGEAVEQEATNSAESSSSHTPFEAFSTSRQDPGHQSPHRENHHQHHHTTNTTTSSVTFTTTTTVITTIIITHTITTTSTTTTTTNTHNN